MDYFEAGSTHMNRIGLYSVLEIIDDERMKVHCGYDDTVKVWKMDISERIENNMRREGKQYNGRWWPK